MLGDMRWAPLNGSDVIDLHDLSGSALRSVQPDGACVHVPRGTLLDALPAARLATFSSAPRRRGSPSPTTCRSTTTVRSDHAGSMSMACGSLREPTPRSLPEIPGMPESPTFAGSAVNHSDVLDLHDLDLFLAAR